jgi:hypothetical protein
VKLDPDTIAEYTERVTARDSFPPVDIFHDGSEFWLGGGFHRYYAHHRAGKKTIACTINKGSRRDAVLFSCVANATHGLRRTDADKRKAVATLLSDEEWSQLSDRKIAELCHVSHTFVAGVRKQLATNASCQLPEKRVGRDGKARKAPEKRTVEPVADSPKVETREPGDDTEIMAADKAKRQASGKEVIPAKERREAQKAFGVVTRFIDKLKRHDELRPHLVALAAVLEGDK